jgi:hypothetical protein
MVTRRDVVAVGALGALGVAADAASPVVAPAATADGTAGGAEQSAETISAQALRDIAEDIDGIRLQLREAFIGPSLSAGIVGDVRKQFAIFLRANQKYPDFCEIGPSVFTDLYDWHVRYQQPLEVSRVDNRTAIRFMFTWMILRPEQADGYIGIPFDRG